jgi:hypothetical protein
MEKQQQTQQSMKTHTIKTRKNLKIKTDVSPKHEMEDSTNLDAYQANFDKVKAVRKEGNLIHKLIGNETATRAIFHPKPYENILPTSSRNKNIYSDENRVIRSKKGYLIDSIGSGRWNFIAYFIKNNECVLIFHFTVDDNGLILEDGLASSFGGPGPCGLPQKAHKSNEMQDYLDVLIDLLLANQEHGKKIWDEVK